MHLNKKQFFQMIKTFQFRELFNELGWDNATKKESVAIDNDVYQLEAVAEKRDVVIFVCRPENADQPIPKYAVRKKIDAIVTQWHFEHLIIYVDNEKHQQVWQAIVREPGKPLIIREIRYYAHQEPELLFQKLKGLFFSFDEEDNIRLVDVKQRITDSLNVNADKITKKFYTEFKKQHTEFMKFIKGIKEQSDVDWYTSLMLNRLMFIYFIQKKGFLDNDREYLKNKLEQTRERRGTDKFYKTFYRSFLLTLFHEGLGAPNHSDELEKELGNVPYLNGGLFEVHELEEKYDACDIDDRAFEGIFDFFDQYEWHLDTNVRASGKEINPDVIGYIFEKYINDRAAMGAYYTKEDITEYIAKNCIIPFLCDEVKRQYPKAMAKDSEIWGMLRKDPDRYIYDAVSHGADRELPKEIEAGVRDVSKRGEWNTPAPLEYALPTEIWREVAARRERYAEVRGKIESGEITEINDFITYNLNIRQFVQDMIENSTDADFVRYFYKGLSGLTVLDPTCGSGAFLFAALNILEPLYEAALQRMENFVAESDKKGKHKFFEETLAGINASEHPNLQYFIYKSVILNNLYGVDVMREATEIAKLRLFLKLAACVDADYSKPNLGLEPLPDIDFNIRTGNTLVGFATETELDDALTYTIEGVAAKPDILEKTDIVARAFSRYKEIQLTYGDEAVGFGEAKDALKARLRELNEVLNFYLAGVYGVRQGSKGEYENWLKSHQPFHWFAEFYEIVRGKGGFDVIIGNPPYVEYSKVKKDYVIRGYETEKCGNLYAYVMESSTKIIKENGFLGMIVPLSSFSTSRMSSLQNLFQSNGLNLYISNFEATSNPSTLFIGVKIQLSIILMKKKNKNNAVIFTTNYMRTYADERIYLFHRIKYLKNIKKNNLYLRCFHPIEIEIIKKIFKNKKTLSSYFEKFDKYSVFFRNMGNFFFKLSFLEEPLYYKNGIPKSSSTVSNLSVRNEEDRKIFVAVINTTLFYYYWILFSDCYHLSKKDVGNFPLDIDAINPIYKRKLVELCDSYLKELDRFVVWQIENKKDGTEKKYKRYFPQNCKIISDEIDKVLAQHYGFTDEELDFIINYDIKYRMGKELNSGEED